jgi:hypothetical protein
MLTRWRKVAVQFHFGPHARLPSLFAFLAVGALALLFGEILSTRPGLCAAGVPVQYRILGSSLLGRLDPLLLRGRLCAAGFVMGRLCLPRN